MLHTTPHGTNDDAHTCYQAWASISDSQCGVCYLLASSPTTKYTRNKTAPNSSTGVVTLCPAVTS
jgi:hypothetical protein